MQIQCCVKLWIAVLHVLQLHFVTGGEGLRLPAVTLPAAKHWPTSGAASFFREKSSVFCRSCKYIGLRLLSGVPQMSFYFQQVWFHSYSWLICTIVSIYVGFIMCRYYVWGYKKEWSYSARSEKHKVFINQHFVTVIGHLCMCCLKFQWRLSTATS